MLRVVGLGLKDIGFRVEGSEHDIPSNEAPVVYRCADRLPNFGQLIPRPPKGFNKWNPLIIP